MVQAAQLRNSPVFQRTQSANGLNALRNNPLNFLQNNLLYVNVAPGHLTAVNAGTSFTCANNVARIGINAMGNGVVAVPCLETPMRANAGPGFVNRLAAVQRFGLGHGGTDLWITDQQTGCSVLVLDWGGNQYSMVHIQPYRQSSYGYTLSGAMKFGSGVEAPIQNSYLRGDMSNVVNTSLIGGVQPQRYILVQSQYSLNNRNLLQLIGVHRMGAWEFYIQAIQVTGTGHQISSAQQVNWRNWNADYVWHSVFS